MCLFVCCDPVLLSPSAVIVIVMVMVVIVVVVSVMVVVVVMLMVKESVYCCDSVLLTVSCFGHGQGLCLLL